MEDNKIFYLTGIGALIVLILAAIGFLFVFIWQKPFSAKEPALINQVTTTPSFGTLPQTPVDSNGPTTPSPEEQLAKEKYFISTFYQAATSTTVAKIPDLDLPLANVKEQILNYRDFSRKIPIENALPKLSNNGFVVINNPFGNVTSNWQTAFSLINEKNVPALITSDAVIGLYQDTLQIIYKEIEQDKFYASLWQLLHDLFNQVKARYDVKRQQFGIESDLITEANRLELAYLTVALKLLAPEPSQLRESITAQRQFFSPFENETYQITVPPYLINDVESEIRLIDAKVKSAKSPILLYQQSYTPYLIPAQYQASEKLKNYYLAITWLNQVFFPLNAKNGDCPDCLLDEPDQRLGFLAALYLSDDLGSNQRLKNQWANIYKTIAFFKGLETDLTYLDYHYALENEFGKDFHLDQIFKTDVETIKQKLDLLKKRLLDIKFSRALRASTKAKDLGWRLLRNYFLTEEKIFTDLTGQNPGNYLGTVNDPKRPNTSCSQKQNLSRCRPTSLDIFNVLGNNQAAEILTDTKNNQYQNYQQITDSLKSALQEFDQNTWHDNSYLSLFSALQSFKTDKPNGYTDFMKNDVWKKKNLQTALGAWTNFHREIKYEKTSSQSFAGFPNYFGYGYIEPQAETYAQLLANVKMIKKGFSALQIIGSGEKSYERLSNLENLLNNILQITKKELANNELSADDYNFINNFSRTINLLTGEIKKENLQNLYTLSLVFPGQKVLNEFIDGFNYLIVVYPDKNGKLFFAIGPVLNYFENQKIPAAWQKEFK